MSVWRRVGVRQDTVVISQIDRILAATEDYNVANARRKYSFSPGYLDQYPEILERERLPSVRIHMRAGGVIETIRTDSADQNFMESKGSYTILTPGEEPSWVVNICLYGGRNDVEHGFVQVGGDRRTRVLAARTLIERYGVSPQKKFMLTFRGDSRFFPELDPVKLSWGTYIPLDKIEAFRKGTYVPPSNPYTLSDIASLDPDQKIGSD